MTNSLPSRSSQFRKSANHSTDDTLKKKHGSLKIVTTTEKYDTTSSPSSVRQKLSSLFRTSSPVVMTIKETFHKRASLSTVSFTPAIVEEGMEPMDDTHSTTTTLSSDSSDHMPSSPADNKALFSWQELTFETKKVSTLPPPIPVHFAMTKSSSSLAFQVHQILGSTLDEVDEEIDKDWETSRNKLRQSLVPNRSQWL